MIGKLISLVFFFVIGWVVYTQIFGTVKEQEMGQEVISNGKETIQSIFNIFQHESDKVQAGDYDESIEKVGKLLNDLRSEASSDEQKEKLAELEKEKDRISKEIQDSKNSDNPVVNEKNKEDLKNLVKNIDKLLESM
jgi:hypothetical protein